MKKRNYNKFIKGKNKNNEEYKKGSKEAWGWLEVLTLSVYNLFHERKQKEDFQGHIDFGLKSR